MITTIDRYLVYLRGISYNFIHVTHVSFFPTLFGHRR